LVFPLFLACLTGALAPAAGGARPRDDRGPLPWRVGGEFGFTVDAASFPDSAGHVLEVYVRLSPATLISLAGGRPEGARFKLALTLKNSFGGIVRRLEQDFVASGGDTAGGFGKVVMFPFRTSPGVHRLQLKMSGVRPPVGKVRAGRTQVASVDGEVTVPASQGGSDLSDLEFVWSEAGGPEHASFRRGDRVLLPNPERLYGLYADSLRATFVARSPAGSERPWRWVARILDAGGRVVAARESTGAAGRWLNASLKTDVSHEPAGGYDLEVKAWQEGDTGALLQRAHFSIAWEKASWTVNPQDILDGAHLLLSPDAEEGFALMQPGEQERVMSDFWRERDPTPDTGVNEAREAYLKRADFANRTYGRFGLGKGMFSDMGRVFIRYGEPSEVLKQVIPARDNTLAEMIRQLVAADTREVGDVNDKRMGADMRPFEVWIYEGDIPLPLDADPHSSHMLRTRGRRLVFLFVDEQWLGDYRLRYSTE
jgi:GWxTD domain-containing protein